MRITKHNSLNFEAAFGIFMASIEGQAIGGIGQPGLSWGRVKPGERSIPHRHDEVELFVIVEGTARIFNGAEFYDLEAGDVVEISPFDNHIIENTGEFDLLFLDIYWRDPKLSTIIQPSKKRENGPLFVFSTPPTPNGDLHIGHLSGPYIGADIFTRFQKMCGREVYHLTGSDDYQSYVEARAITEDRKPEEVAAHYSAEILKTLSLLDCEIDQYTVTNQCSNYGERITELFQRVLKHDAVIPRISPAVYEKKTGLYQYEPYVSGKCPNCGSNAGGNICEECGAPNFCHDLIDLKLNDGTADIREIERIEIDLSLFSDSLHSHAEKAAIPERIRELQRRVLDHGNIHVPISHPSDWGISTGVHNGQVIWVWPEMAFGFLIGIEELGLRLGKNWQSIAPSDDWEIVHFFGFDNSFYHTILYPALYEAALPNWKPDITYCVNEFYLLDEQKFSTSRRHAIWGKDILTPDSVDPLRLYLCVTRPETSRSNFSRDEYNKFEHEVFDRKINIWLGNLLNDAKRYYDATVPDAGDWTPQHIAFFHRLELIRARFEASLDAKEFSTRRAARLLLELIDEAREFSNAQRLLKGLGGDRARTVMALELSAAALLCSMASPLMPSFARRLADVLGAPLHENWPDSVQLLTAGTLLSPSVKSESVWNDVTAAE